MTTYIDDISDGELPRVLSGLGQTSTGRVFDDGPGTVTVLAQGVKAPRQVKQMQLLLNQFGYKLSTDGIFGAGTAAAVSAVQKKLNMAVTGRYDKALDERIVGMNQSGIIDVKPGEVLAVAVKPPPGNGNTIKPVVSITGQPVTGPATLAPMPSTGRFIDDLRDKWQRFRADPNFKYYAAGAAAVVVVGGGLLVVGSAPQVQVNGYRRSRR